MTPRQLADAASSIRSGFGNGADFDDEPQELDFDDEDAPPIDPDTICECGVEKESDEDRCAICERDRHDAWGSDKYDNAGDR
jgi:hypothetical protein